MTTLLRVRLLTVLFLAFGCKDGGGKDEGGDDPHAKLVQACLGNCLKPLCSTTITVGPGYEAECELLCEDRVSQAEEDGCFQEYEALLACLEETSCEMYYLWYDQEPNAPCTELETELMSPCPSIEVRDSD